jgi:hypothetical protein
MIPTWTREGSALTGWLRLAAAVLCLPALLAGCPRAAGDAEPAAPEPPAADAERIQVRVTDAEGLRVQDAWLGMSPETFLARRPAGSGMAVESQWVEAERTGMIGVSPAGRSPLPVESAAFLDGALQGFAYTIAVDEADVLPLVERIEAALGEAAGAPPAWCEGSAFFAGYEPPADDARAWFWGDQQRRAVLVLSDDPEAGSVTLLLAQVDEFRRAVDACVDPLIEEMAEAARAEIAE